MWIRLNSCQDMKLIQAGRIKRSETGRGKKKGESLLSVPIILLQ